MATVAVPVSDNAAPYKVWAWRFLRTAQAALIVLLAYKLGHFLGAKYGPLVTPEGNDELLKWSIFSTAGLSTLKELFGTAPKVKSFVWEGKGDGLYDLSSFVLLTSLTIAIAALGIKANADPTIGGQVPPASQNADQSNRGGGTPFALLLMPSGRNERFLVPFSDNAGGCEEGTDDFKAGLKRFNGTDNFIGELGKGLMACSASGRTIKVEIRGYASSAAFKNKKTDAQCLNSDHLNIAVANLRAATVRDEMTKATNGSASIHITAKQWTDQEFSVMRKEAFFNDRNGTNADKNRGDLTRRADIVVVDAGDCEPR